MNARLFAQLGSIAGALGVVLCLATGIARIAGLSVLVGFESLTLFVAGIGIITTGCLLKLHALEISTHTAPGNN